MTIDPIIRNITIERIRMFFEESNLPSLLPSNVSTPLAATSAIVAETKTRMRF